MATSHNGGRSQVNLNFLQFGGDYPFLNIAKTGQAWAHRSGSPIPPVTPDELNSDGYPISIKNGGVSTRVFIPSQVDRPGNYVFTWTGNGTIYLSAAATALSTATFTGSVASNVLTAGAPSGGSIQKGMTLSTGGVVGAQLSGSAGLAGTYTVIGGTNAGSQTITVSGGSLTSSTGSGRYVFTPGATIVDFGISVLGSPIISDLKFFHVDDEAAINNGEVFGAKFKERLLEGSFGVIRFLNWGGYASGFNGSNVTTWASRKPISYVFYAGYHLDPNLYVTSATSLSGQDYSVTGPVGFALADKAMVHLVYGQSYVSTLVTFTDASSTIHMPSHNLSVGRRFFFGKNSAGDAGAAPGNFDLTTTLYVVSVIDADNITASATPGGTAIVASGVGSGKVYANPLLTMNVSGTGAFDLRGPNGSRLSNSNNTYPVSGSYQSLATLVYDAVLNVWMEFGGNAAIGNMGIDSGVPPELMVQLAFELGMHPWFTLPTFALDPPTNYVPELMNYIKNYSGASWMTPRFEGGPNELWNNAAGFYQTGYAANKAAIEWTGGNYHDWYGKVASLVGQIAANIYGLSNLGATYHIMVGVQTGLGDTSGNRANFVPRLTSDKFGAQAGSVPSLTWSGGTISFTKSAASGWVSHLNIANYITPSDYPASPTTGNEPARVTALGGVRFVATIAAGAMSVSSIDISGGALAIGMTVFGRRIAGGKLQSGVKIVSGSAPNWILSDSSLTMASDTIYAAVDMTQPALYVDSLNDGVGSFSISKTLTLYGNWKSWAAGLGVNKLAFYEGGYSPDYSGGSSSPTNILRAASKLVLSSPGNSLGLHGYTRMNYDNCIAAGGEFPSCFQFSGTYPSGSDWAVLEDIYQQGPPQWEAMRLFNARKRRLVLKT